MPIISQKGSPGGGSSTPDSWIMAFQTAQHTPDAQFLVFSGAEGAGTDLTLSNDGTHVQVATSGLYQIRLEILQVVVSGTPLGYLFASPNVTGGPSPGYWSDGDIADGIPVIGAAIVGNTPMFYDSPVAKLLAGATIGFNPSYQDAASAVLALKAGTGIYVVKVGSLT